MRRLTSPSLLWALSIFTGIGQPKPEKKDTGCGEGCITLLLWPIRVIARPYFAYLYVQHEGMWYDNAKGDLVVRDFKEPTGLKDFYRRFMTAKWLDEERMPITSIKNFEKSEGLLWVSIVAVGPGNAKMPSITIGDDFKDVQRRIKTVTTVAENQAYIREVDEKARLEIDVEDKKKRRRSS